MAEVGGAALGAAFGELLNTVLEWKNNAIMFKSTLVNLQSILKELDPIIKEIAQQNNDLGRPKEELESLISEMEKGSKLISKCSQIHKLNYFAKLRYQKKLKALLDSLHMFFMVRMLAQLVRDQKETLLNIRRMPLVFERIEDTTSLDDTEINDSIESAMEISSV
ncbi:hypothetical protein Fmac_012035 [Flemingia macrophylla]|uniref:RPW8 domain-containing protein n=1 Tax=Flemingia macrophylla TaxID=520843 RepID=A0ABD1MP44_9FABA